MPLGMNTPWGRADSCKNIGLGILSVTTSSHGGYFVPKELLCLVSKEHRDWAKKWSGSEQWYEEDCCWAAVAVSFPHLFPSHALPVAESILKKDLT